ncbi:hypothetical protein [Bacillus sp. 1P06AnD]|uniref:hypothetical protein n=1 Tax=Bacillus sp. 1P06AnD TaxID=3132208 RepID=UPI00399F724B
MISIHIKQYYRQTAQQCLNMAFFSLLVSSIVFVINHFFFPKQAIWVAVIPFIAFSILFFIQFRINYKRYKDIPGIGPESGADLLREKHILMAYMPAPTLRVLLYSKEGLFQGEIADQNTSWYKWFIPDSIAEILPTVYVLLDANGERIATFSHTRFFSGTWSIKGRDGRPLYTYKENWKKSLFRYSGVVEDETGKPILDIDAGGFLQQFTIPFSGSSKEAATFQKGWMPLEWAERFKELNTPILTFSSEASENERVAIFGVCARLLKNRNN